MLELIIEQKDKESKSIALVQNAELIEYYEQTNDIDRNEGNIYIGIIKDIIKGMQAAFIDIGTEKNGFIHVKDVLPKIDETKENYEKDLKIENIIKRGQKILVQVKKDSSEKKGARVSTHINLPGKYIALMPNTDIITTSQKIEDENERKRLIKLVKENISKGNGAIIRTSAQNKTEEIIEDIKRLENKWEDIIQTSVDPQNNKPQLLYKSEDIVERIFLDLTNKKIDKVIVNNQILFKEIEKIKKQNKEYQNLPIEIKDDVFSIYNLKNQIEKAKNRKIWLNCGGFITIDKTEALTAIDVNTGKYTGNKELEKTVYKVNEEATIEIAKQLRLRDIGGIIIIDYIDMKEQQNKDKIEKMLKEELKKDRAKTQIEGFTKLDLMELTRKHICSHKQ